MRYAAYLRAYRDGEIDAAATGVSELWSTRKPGTAIFEGLDAAQASAAIVLQCDLAWYALVNGPHEDAVRQLQIAERLVDLRVMKDDRTPQVRTVRRRGYLFSAWVWALLDKRDLLDAAIGRALKQFPDDADFLIARGSLRERRRLDLVTVPAPQNHDNRVAMMRIAQADTDAAGWFRRALAADPTRVEARMRLARTLIDAGRLDEARRELEKANATYARLDKDQRLRELRMQHLVHFLLGSLDARVGKWSAAAAEYRQASSFCPLAQSARVAESHAALMAGDETAARTAVARLVRPRPSNLADACGMGEPWQDYSYGQGWRLPTLLAELRALVREPRP